MRQKCILARLELIISYLKPIRCLVLDRHRTYISSSKIKIMRRTHDKALHFKQLYISNSVTMTAKMGDNLWPTLSVTNRIKMLTINILQPIYLYWRLNIPKPKLKLIWRQWLFWTMMFPTQNQAKKEVGIVRHNINEINIGFIRTRKFSSRITPNNPTSRIFTYY